MHPVKAADLSANLEQSMKRCPCGLHLDYSDCCGLYLSNKAIPKTAEALMRSRYTAYTLGNMDYIKRTMQGKPLVGFNEIEAAKRSESIQWLGLKVIKTCQQDEHTGIVEFIANYMENGWVKAIREISQFQVIHGCWFYVDGELISIPPTKISRNALCPCGSKKKFKACHARS
jgi:SEC-C motif-containing protein